jgi:hypothetical protein
VHGEIVRGAAGRLVQFPTHALRMDPEEMQHARTERNSCACLDRPRIARIDLVPGVRFENTEATT